MNDNDEEEEHSEQDDRLGERRKPRIFDLTRGLIVAVTKGVKRLIHDGHVPEVELIEPELELQLNLVQRLLKVLGHSLTHAEALQAIVEGDSLHQFIVTLDGHSRKIFLREDYAPGRYASHL